LERLGGAIARVPRALPGRWPDIITPNCMSFDIADAPKASDVAAQWSRRGYPMAIARVATRSLIDRPLISGIAKRPIEGAVGVASTRTLHPTPLTKRSASGIPTAIAVRPDEPSSSVPQMLATFVRPPPDGEEGRRGHRRRADGDRKNSDQSTGRSSVVALPRVVKKSPAKSGASHC
jgi:hypothetical protein